MSHLASSYEYESAKAREVKSYTITLQMRVLCHSLFLIQGQSQVHLTSIFREEEVKGYKWEELGMNGDKAAAAHCAVLF